MQTVMKMLEGILIGAIGGLVILYGLRPTEAYPAWMLIPYDHPWVFLVLLLVIVYIGAYHRLIGGLLFLLVASLYVDLVLFGRPTIFKRDRLPVDKLPTEEVKEITQPTVSSSAKWENIGIPLSDVNITEPNYPLVQGLYDSQPGEPAEFLPSL